MLDFDQLYVFTHIAKSLNITQSAKQLGCSKAHVSQSLKQLESRLQVKLIERSTRKLLLTERGHALYTDMSDAFAQIIQAVERLEAQQEKPKGRLRISAPIEFGHYLSQRVLGDFLARYPDVSIDLDLTPDRRDLLGDGLDLLVRVGPVQDSQLIYRKIFDAHMGVFCAPQHVHRLQRLQDVGAFKWIAAGQEAELLGPEHPLLAAQGPTVMVCKNLTARKHLIADGVGIGLLPGFIFTQEIQRGEIVQVLPDVQSAPIPFGFIYASQQYTPLKIRYFVDFVVERIGTRVLQKRPIPQPINQSPESAPPHSRAAEQG
ncbi:MAG: LysR family transcriptional regulator [Candidatus Sericytochromatia bacterium]